MGQKTSPVGFRTGITREWQSIWFSPKATYGDFLVEDEKIRRFIDKKFNRQMPKGAVSKVKIIRTRNEIQVTLHSARPGIVIGPRGGEVDKLREELETLTGRKVNVNVIEVKAPELDAVLVAEAIAEQLCKRASFRRTMKQYCDSAMNAGAKGVKIICGGRLAGSEMARRETQKVGSIPLHTLDADVDYAVATARTTYGAIGIKVWIYRGKFGEQQVETRQVRRRRPGRRADGRKGGRAAGGSAAAVKDKRSEKAQSAPLGSKARFDESRRAARPAAAEEQKQQPEQNDSDAEKK
jgi:small subunit ribosomal protein S3